MEKFFGGSFDMLNLFRYILFHGYKFSKSDHIAFVNLFLELILIPGLDYTLLSEFVAVLLKLLK